MENNQLMNNQMNDGGYYWCLLECMGPCVDECNKAVSVGHIGDRPCMMKRVTDSY